MEQEEKSGLECVGYMAFGRVDGKLTPLCAYTAETELAVRRKIMDVAWKDGYRGNHVERMLELGWSVHPIYAKTQ